MFPIGDENRPALRPYVNYILLLVNVVVFFLFFAGGNTTLITGILNLGAIPSYILRGDRLWTLLTSMFMHADPIHLLGNMLYLWVFGDNIEDALGHGKYLLFYIFGGFAASFTHIASVLLTPNNSFALDIPSVGASGSISAILGAYLLLYPNARIRTLVIRIFVSIVRVPAIFYLGFWFFYQFLMGVISLTGLSSGIAFWAHIGGFLFGALIVKALEVRPRRKRMRIIRMRRCRYCGHENHPEAIYCSYCGNVLR